MTLGFPLLVNANQRPQAIAYHLWVLASWLLLTGCQPLRVPLQLPTVATPATRIPAATATPAVFTYGITVLDSENNPVPDAHVLIEIEGQAPLDEYADANGYARIVITATHAKRPGRLTVNARGYEVAISNIDLYQDRLPDTVRLTAKVVGNTAGFCPDNLTFATGFAPAKKDETLVVVTNFADTLGNDPRNLTFDLVERMIETLKPHDKIRVERLNCAIKQQDGSETAMRIGSRSDIDASIVIWGVYVEPPDPEVRIYFDIVKQQETYLKAGFDHSFGPQVIQPSMFDFKASLGEQVGEVVAFVAALALFNASNHLAAEPLFTTAIAAADQPLAVDFARALRYYRGTNYWYLGRFLEAKPDLDSLKPQAELMPTTLDDLDLAILNILGLVYDALGEKQQALDYYNQALPLRRAVGDKAGEATTLNNIGVVYSALGEKQEALDDFTQTLSIFQSIGDKAGEATAFNNVGRVYYDLGDTQQALHYYTQALTIVQEIGDKAKEAGALNNIGGVYSALGDTQQALDYYNQALPLRRAVGDKAGEATTLNDIGFVYSALGDTQQALDYFTQTLSIFQSVGDKAGEATAFNSIGRVYYDLGDTQQALHYYTQALTIVQKIGDKAKEAVSLVNIGRVYYDLGDTQQALDYYTQALPICQLVGDRTIEANILNNIGNIYYDLGDTQPALDYYTQALPLSRAVGDKAGEATTLNNIGTAYYGLGDVEKAIVNINEAADILHKIGAAWSEVTVRSNVAFLQRQNGDLDAAAESIETAITLATKLNHPNLPDLQALLAEINAERGQ